ncbi:MAG: signal peptidase I [Acidobacteriota bacterium]|jgi:signal peptidase I|nr:MAG: signal peptidase I [Acidobacteriota bacterium]
MRRLILGSSPGRTLIRAGVVAAALLLVAQYVISPIRAVGISMMPAYDEGQLLLLNRLAYLTSDPQRGDVVAIAIPGRYAVLVKRIVGLPGERVRIANGVVFVDDRPLDEPYVRYRIPWNVGEVRLGIDEYYVIGDNRSMAEHNHDFGVASRDRILGRLIG